MTIEMTNSGILEIRAEQGAEDYLLNKWLVDNFRPIKGEDSYEIHAVSFVFQSSSQVPDNILDDLEENFELIPSKFSEEE